MCMISNNNHKYHHHKNMLTDIFHPTTRFHNDATDDKIVWRYLQQPRNEEWSCKGPAKLPYYERTVNVSYYGN